MVYKYQKIYEDLRTLAGRLPENSKLPTLRTLMEGYGVSQLTVDRAISALRAEGIVESIEGEGFFIKKKTIGFNVKHLKICMAQNDYPSAVFNSIETVFSDAFSKAGHEFKVIRYPWAKGLTSMLQPGIVDAFIALPPRADMQKRDTDFLKTLNIPVVSVLADLSDHGIDSIKTNFELSGMIAAELLIKQGRAKLLFLSGEPISVDYKDMRNGFMQRCLLSGLPEPKVIDCGTKPGELSIQAAYAGFSHAIENGVQCDGMMAASDSCALGALRACHERSIRVPDQLSIIGFNGTPETQFSFPSISTFRPPLEKWAETAVRMILTRLEGRTDVWRESFAPELIARESTSFSQKVSVSA